MAFSLVADDLFRQGSHIREDGPSWDLVEKCLRRLDGNRFTEVFISDAESCGLLITGGWQGRYMCERLGMNGNHTLTDPTKADGGDQAIMGDGPPDFPADYIVDLEMAVRAAQYFLVNRDLDPSLNWQS